MITLLSASLFAVSVPLTMFLFVLWWFSRLAKAEHVASRRGMFGFNDGKNDRWVDPIQVMMSFEMHPEYRADIHPSQLSEGNKEAVRILTDAVKRAFGVIDYTSPKLPGLTINEMIGLWESFYDWVDVQKKSTQCDRICAESTEPTSKESEKETMSSTSDSGLTDGAELASNR